MGRMKMDEGVTSFKCLTHLVASPGVAHPVDVPGNTVHGRTACSNEGNLHALQAPQTDKQAGRQAGRQTDQQTDGQTCRQSAAG